MLGYDEDPIVDITYKNPFSIDDIVISFVKGKLFPPEEPMHSVYRMREDTTYRKFKDVLELVTTGDEVIGMIDKVLRKISEEDRLRELRLAREKMEILMGMEKRSGYDEGVAQGIAQEKRQIAANFKASGIAADIIAANTGLSKEEIAKL